MKMSYYPLLLTAALLPAGAGAGEFEVAVGGFLSKANTSIGVYEPITGIDKELDFETDLDLKEQELLPYLQVAYRFNDKHAMYLDWRRLHREATVGALSKPFRIEWDDKIYEAQVGGQITSTLNIDLARLAYGYKFFDDEDWDIEVIGGLHLMKIEVGFTGAIGGRLDDDEKIYDIGNPIFQDVTAPLPNFGLLGSYKFNDDWSITAHSQFFYIKYQEIKGLLIDTSFGVTYNFTENLSTTGSVTYYEIGVDYGGASGDLDVNFQFYGPMLTLNYQF